MPRARPPRRGLPPLKPRRPAKRENGRASVPLSSPMGICRALVNIAENPSSDKRRRPIARGYAGRRKNVMLWQNRRGLTTPTRTLLDDHSLAPPGSAPPFPLRRPPSARDRESRLAPPARLYSRTAPRPKLRTTDRLFWVGLARVWTGWRQSLLIVTPDTVLRRQG